MAAPSSKGRKLDDKDKSEAIPEGCIANMVSFTTPRDACRLAVVSKLFWSASESDVVWERFLPPDWQAILSRLDSGGELVADLQTKKQVYMRLASRPFLLDSGTKSFWIEKSRGTICWMLSAKSLTILWNNPKYWDWRGTPESRFSQVAVLKEVCFLEIDGTVKTSMLSPQMCYSAYLVFKMTEDAYGFDNVQAKTVLISSGAKDENVAFLAYEKPRFLPHAYYTDRRTDGWLEVKIGDFFTYAGEEEAEIEFSVMEVTSGYWKGGLIVEGVEIRPGNH